jgi:hypothetical protein
MRNTRVIWNNTVQLFNIETITELGVYFHSAEITKFEIVPRRRNHKGYYIVEAILKHNSTKYSHWYLTAARFFGSEVKVPFEFTRKDISLFKVTSDKDSALHGDFGNNEISELRQIYLCSMHNDNLEELYLDYEKYDFYNQKYEVIY